jgi:hypothetical protein
VTSSRGLRRSGRSALAVIPSGPDAGKRCPERFSDRRHRRAIDER